MLLNKTNIFLLKSSWLFSTIGVFANISNMLTTGALSIFSVFYITSISCYVLSSYADSVLLSISKNTGHLLHFLCNLIAAKLGKFVFENLLVYVLWSTGTVSVIWDQLLDSHSFTHVLSVALTSSGFCIFNLMMETSDGIKWPGKISFH